MRIMSRILPDALPENYTLTLIDRMPFHGLKPEFYALWVLSLIVMFV